MGEHLYYCWEGTSCVDGDEDYFIGDGIDIEPVCFAIETDEGTRPSYPGMGAVINTGLVDADAGMPMGDNDDLTCLPLEVRIDDTDECKIVLVGGQTYQAEVLEGGALRVSMDVRGNGTPQEGQ